MQTRKNNVIIGIPNWVSQKVFNDWVDDSEILLDKENNRDGNYLVLIKYSFDDYKTHLRVLRFFNLNNDTVCSVDYENCIENKKGLTALFVEIMSKFNFSNK